MGFTLPDEHTSDAIAAKDKNAAAFNCAQRAHANFTENHNSFLGLLMIAGLKIPLPAACLGLIRIAYAYGYVNKGTPGRHPWFTGASIISVVTAVMAGYTSYSFAFGNSL